MVMKKPRIISDFREREVCRHFNTKKASVEEKSLQVGDFVLSERVGVERKRIADFLQSIIDQRIFKQVEALSNSYECPLLILEGNPETLFLERGLHENTIRGVLASLAIDFKIPILWTQNPEETANQLFWIANREQVLEKKELQVRANKKSASLSDQQEFLVAGLPGINSKRARKLLKELKSPEKIFRASEKRLLKVNGFGDKVIKRMKDVLKEEYQSKD